MFGLGPTVQHTHLVLFLVTGTCSKQVKIIDFSIDGIVFLNNFMYDGNGHISPARNMRFGFDHHLSHPDFQYLWEYGKMPGDFPGRSKTNQ